MSARRYLIGDPARKARKGRAANNRKVRRVFAARSRKGTMKAGRRLAK